MGTIFFVGVAGIVVAAVWILFSWRPAWALATALVFSTAIVDFLGGEFACGLGGFEENNPAVPAYCTAHGALVHSVAVWYIAAIAVIPVGIGIGALLKNRPITLASPAVAAGLLAYAVVLVQSLQ